MTRVTSSLTRARICTEGRRKFDLLFENFCKISASESKILDPVTARQSTPSRHVLVGRSAYKTEYELCLIKVAAAGQNRLALEHFAKDTP